MSRYSRFTLMMMSATLFVLLSGAARAQDVLIEEIEIRGSRRVPKETVLYSIQSKPGDRYREEMVRRDLEAIINLGVFDPLGAKAFVLEGARGGRVILFEVREYPIIRDIRYQNLKSATESEVLSKFKERRVLFTRDSPFDPVKAQGARRVLREILAEKGHPEAGIELEVQEVSATAVAVNFLIDEGPRVRIKEIVFDGGSPFSRSQLKRALKYTKEAGLLTRFNSKDVYFKDKLDADLEQLRFYLGQRGYLQAKLGEVRIEDAGKVSAGIPIPLPDLPGLPKLRKQGPGLRIVIPVEVGRRYKIKSVAENGVTVFQPGIVTAVSGLRAGDWADAKKISENVFKGVKDLYGTQGYIQANVDFIPKFMDTSEEEGEVEVKLEVDEGRQFTLRRLEFIGNTVTRDVVLRREVLLLEGDPYNKRYWDLSLLRLNQLGLFEEIKERDAITRTQGRDQTVDIDLQVKERGRQQIQVNGGVSGFAGSFFGLSYSTNNLLGYGQTLSFSVSGGNRQLLGSVGYRMPYVLGKPISFGIDLFAQRQQYFGNNFNTFSQFLTTTGQRQAELDSLFTQEVVGGSVDLGAPLALLTRRFRDKAQFTRFGLSYSLAASRTIDPKVNRDGDKSNDIPVTYSQPRILTSRLTPSLFYNTTNSPLDATRGQSLFVSLGIAGGFLGGDVNTLSPSLEYKYFRPVAGGNTERPHVIGLRFGAAHVRTFGRLSERLVNTQSLGFIGGIPITERFFLGGENDIRGYNVFSISPVARYDNFRSSRNVAAKVQNSSGELEDAADGSVHPSVPRRFTYDAPENGCGFVKSAGCNVARIVRKDDDGNEIPFYTAIGGDTRLVFNGEYRIPLAGPVALAAFADVGAVFNLRRYRDQIVTSNFVGDSPITSETGVDGVILNSSGVIARRDELDSALAANPDRVTDGLPPGFRRVFLRGDLRAYNLLRLSQKNNSFMENLRASVGLEFRVQMPVLNVPFRLIFAYNPNTNPDITNPKVLSLERRTIMRFSIGRTF
jgi:outer membrane protein insertion porin family